MIITFIFPFFDLYFIHFTCVCAKKKINPQININHLERINNNNNTNQFDNNQDRDQKKKKKYDLAKCIRNKIKIKCFF